MVLEILTINIRSNKNIQGIMVGGENITLEIFADDLTAFLLNDILILRFLKLLEGFGECSGLKIYRDKSEIMLLGDHGNLPCDQAYFRGIKIKGALVVVNPQNLQL